MPSANRQKRPLLFFGNDWGSDNRTSSHHLARHLSETYEVYFIECPGLRAVQGTGRDLKKIVDKVRKFFSGPVRVTPDLTVRTLLQIPSHQNALVSRLNRLVILATVRFWMWRERIKNPILWFHIPHVESLVGNLDECLSVYFCVDDHSSYPGADSRIIQRMDEELTKKVDLVFTISEPLVQAKLKLNPSSFLVAHGVDTAHFGLAQNPSTEIPPELRGLSRPVVGYFGLVGEWIDVDMLARIARARPSWNLVILGRVALKQAPPRLPNLHFLGSKAYEELPHFGRAFDVAIIPYRFDSTWGFHANPLKLREYLAMGKPIVATSTPEIDKFADIIETARSEEEFLGKLDKVLTRPDLPASIRARLERVAPQSWSRRAAWLRDTMEEHLRNAPAKSASLRRA